MLSKIGTTELLVILGIALLIFGPTKLPKLGKSIGKTISGFKKGLKDEVDQIDTEVSEKAASKAEKD